MRTLALAALVFAASPAGSTPVVSEALRFKAEAPPGWTAGRDGRELSAPSPNPATPKGIEVGFEPGASTDALSLIRERSRAQTDGPGRASASPFGTHGRWRTVTARLKRDGGVLLAWAALDAPGGAYLVTLYAPESDAKSALADLDRFLDSFQPSPREMTFRSAKACGGGCSLDLPGDWEVRSDGDTTTAYGPAAAGGRPLLRIERVAKPAAGGAAAYLAAEAGRPGVTAAPVQRQAGRAGALLVMETRRTAAPELVERRAPAVDLRTAWGVFEAGDGLIVVSCEAPAGAYGDCATAQRRAVKSLIRR